MELVEQAAAGKCTVTVFARSARAVQAFYAGPGPERWVRGERDDDDGQGPRSSRCGGRRALASIAPNAWQRCGGERGSRMTSWPCG